MGKQAFRLTKTTAVALCILLASSCSKRIDKVNQSEALDDSTSRVPTVVAQKPSLHKPDANTSLSTYKQINNNNDLMFTYHALSGTAIDYERIMKNYSVEYWNTRDEFEKQDLVNKFRPELDKQIAEFKDSRYLKLDIKSTWKLKKYDFVKKGFPQMALSSSSQFGWDKNEWVNSGSIAESYFVKFINGDDYELLRVEDEKVARLIESKLADELHLIVYGFIQEVDPKQPFLNMQVMKVSLVDGNGAQLLQLDQNASSTYNTN